MAWKKKVVEKHLMWRGVATGHNENTLEKWSKFPPKSNGIFRFVTPA